MVFPVDWAHFVRNFPLGYQPVFFAEVAGGGRSMKHPARVLPLAVGDVDLVGELTASAGAARRRLLMDHLRGQAARVLGLPAERVVAGDRPLHELGLDSLMAVELRNSLAAGLGMNLSATVLFDYPTLDGLADFLLGEVLALETPAVAAVGVERSAMDEPIAIIGMDCRFPGGADGPDAFWRLLRDGVDAVGEVPPDRWDVGAYYDPDPDVPGRIATRWGAFLA